MAIKPHSNVPLPLQERLANQSKAMMTPMQCPKCTSTWFMDAHAAQYNNGGYGSVQYRLLTVTPVPVKMCLCGHIFAPAPTAGKASLGSEPSFQESVRLAAEYRIQQEINAQVVASKRELDGVETNLRELEARFQESLLQAVQQPVEVVELASEETPPEPPPTPDMGSMRPRRRRG